MKKLKINNIRFWRRTVQTSIAVFFALIPLLNANGFKFVWGNFLNTHIGSLTFSDPLAVLQVMISNRIIPPGLLLGAGLVLGISFFFGIVFCSWMCPFGLLSELTNTLARRSKLGKNINIKFLKNAPAVKLIIFCAGFTAVFLFFRSPALNQVSLPFQYSNIFQYMFMQKYIFGATWFLIMVLSIEFIFCKRLWCRWICPQSVLIIIAGRLNPLGLKIIFKQKNCISAKASPPCQKACSLDLDPRKIVLTNQLQCNNCGDCIDACRKTGKAIDFGFKKYYK